MKNDKQDISEIIEGLHLDEANARRVAQEINSSDKAFEHHDNVTLDPALQAKIEAELRYRLAQSNQPGHNRQTTWARVILRAAAVLIFILAVTTVLNINQHDSAVPVDSPTMIAAVEQADIDLIENELALWDLAMTMDDSEELDVDEIVFAEVLMLLEEEPEPLSSIDTNAKSQGNV